MAPKLYYTPASPPVRAVLMTAKAIGLQLDLKHVNLLQGEHLTPEYIERNPLHTVPTLEDGDFILSDSHAIVTYLIEQYSEDDTLYPDDLTLRGLVNQRLHFDTGVLSARFGFASRKLLFRGIPVDDQDVQNIQEAYGFLEAFFEKGPYVAGNTVTVADLSIIATLSSSNVLVPLKPEKFPKVAAWMKRIEALPCYRANKEGLEIYKVFVKSKINK